MNHKQKQTILKKWEKSGLLDQLDELNESDIASLMECEAAQLLREQLEKENKINEKYE